MLNVLEDYAKKECRVISGVQELHRWEYKLISALVY